MALLTKTDFILFLECPNNVWVNIQYQVPKGQVSAQP